MGNTPSSDNFDPYTILDIEKDASDQEIELAYKHKALKFHPDKNRGKPDIKERENQFKLVCLAYEVLSDPTKRSQYNQGYAPTFDTLRKTYNKYENKIQSSKTTDSKNKYLSEGRFDNKAFNDAFTKNRKADPNDHGYGTDMAPRLEKEDIDPGTGRRNDEIEGPTRIFGDGKFDQNVFNQLFEHYKKESGDEHGMVERFDGDPAGYSMLGQTQFTDVSVYNGAMILGQDTNDYSSSYSTPTTKYTDYQRGYKAAKNPDKVDRSTLNDLKQKKYEGVDSQLSQQEFNKRLQDLQSGRTEELVPEINKSDRKRAFIEAEMRLLQQQQDEMEQEQRKQQEVVLKYKDQFPEHLLDNLGVNNKQDGRRRKPRSARPLEHYSSQENPDRINSDQYESVPNYPGPNFKTPGTLPNFQDPNFQAGMPSSNLQTGSDLFQPSFQNNMKSNINSGGPERTYEDLMRERNQNLFN